MNSDDREVARRVDQVIAGKRNPHTDYTNASEAVKRAHTAFKASKDRHQTPSVMASENYAKSLRDLDICDQVISLTKLQETA